MNDGEQQGTQRGERFAEETEQDTTQTTGAEVTTEEPVDPDRTVEEHGDSPSDGGGTGSNDGLSEDDPAHEANQTDPGAEGDVGTSGVGHPD